MITQKRLREVIKYNPCTGVFVWKVGQYNRRLGRTAGYRTKRGYSTIRVDYKLYLASRLAWLYTYGYWPGIVDHIDENPMNNSIWNLANGTQKDNIRSYYARAWRSLSQTRSS